MATEDFARPPLFYARVAGFIYLFAMALGIFSQVFVLGRMVVPGDAAATANNILAFEGLFRLGIAVDVITFVSDVVIAWAFYELLKSVDKKVCVCWRVFKDCGRGHSCRHDVQRAHYSAVIERR